MQIEKVIKKVLIFLLLFIATYLLIITQLDGFLKKRLENFLSKQNQFVVTIDDLRVDILKGQLIIKGLRSQNPSTYNEHHFLEARLIKVHLNPMSVFQDKLIINELVFDISKLSAVRNIHGRINIIEFVNHIRHLFVRKKVEDNLPYIPSREPKWVIQRLLLKLDELTVADYKSNPTYQHTSSLGYLGVFSNLNSVEPVIEGLTKDVRGIVADFIIDSIIKATMDPHSYIKIIKNILKPIGKLPLTEESVQVAEELIEKFIDPFKKGKNKP